MNTDQRLINMAERNLKRTDITDYQRGQIQAELYALLDAENVRLQEEHDLECWAEEERWANEEAYADDCHFDDCGDDLTDAELDEIDRTTDWDKYESDKRARIAESNEY